MSAKRPSTDEEAALYDAVVVPRWSARFAQMILRAIPRGLRAQVLDVGCGTGHPAFSLLERLDHGGRVIGIDRDPALIDVARRRAMGVPGGRIFFKVESLEALKFGEEVFDLAVGNLVSAELEDPTRALSELRRVLAPQGRVLMTHALEGSFEEIFDMFDEIAVSRGDDALAARLDEVRGRYPEPRSLRAPLRAAGFSDVEITTETFKLSFLNAREILTDQMLRFVALGEWRWIAGFEPGSEHLVEEVVKRLDTYFGGGPMSLTVVVGMASATRR